MMKRRIKIKKPIRIIFFGTPEFSCPSLELLAKQSQFEVSVVTVPPKPAGRSQTNLLPSAVKILADSLQLPVFEPENLLDQDFLNRISSLKPLLFVVAAYGKIIPPKLLRLPPHGALNLHPSLLPKYRGPSPVEAVIRAGETETGVSIMLLDDKIDHGPILSQEIVPIRERETALELGPRLAKIGAQLLAKTIPGWLANEIVPVPQNHEKATYTKLLTREDGRIFWDTPAMALERQIRAYQGWPGSYFIWRRHNEMLRVKVEAARVVEGAIAEKPYGSVWQAAEAPIAVTTIDGSLAVDQLCLEGKDSVSAADFINGYPDIIAATLL